MTLEISWRSGAAFRAQRSGLSRPLPSVAEAAAAVLGAQSQIEAPSRWGLAMRTAATPAATVITDALLKERSVVRAWGQRDTVHIYHADDWHLISQAQRLWPVSSRTGSVPNDTELADFVATIENLGGPFTRTMLLDAAPGRLVDHFREKPVNNDPPERMAITRLIWAAGHAGWLSSVAMVGREQGYVARRVWIPDTIWREMSSDDACVAIVRRYLQTWAPARPADIAHYLGARISDVKRWVSALEDELLPVSFADQAGHIILAADTAHFAPDAIAEAPPRLLPAYDTQMMTHAWKDPLLATAADRPRVWDKAAIVRPTILYQGRFIATWQHRVEGRKVRIEAEPLTGNDAPQLRAAIAEALERDGDALAAHLGLSRI